MLKHTLSFSDEKILPWPVSWFLIRGLALYGTRYILYLSVHSSPGTYNGERLKLRCCQALTTSMIPHPLRTLRPFSRHPCEYFLTRRTDHDPRRSSKILSCRHDMLCRIWKQVLDQRKLYDPHAATWARSYRSRMYSVLPGRSRSWTVLLYCCSGIYGLSEVWSTFKAFKFSPSTLVVPYWRTV